MVAAPPRGLLRFAQLASLRERSAPFDVPPEEGWSADYRSTEHDVRSGLNFQARTATSPIMSSDAEAGIYARESAYLRRHVQVGVAGGRVLSVSFPGAPDDDAGTDLPFLDRVVAYLEGAETDFSDVDVAMTMPTDRRDVLEAVREVPYGEDVSVSALARMTPGLDPDDEEVARLVRTALAENPAPLVVPDHRVRGPGAAPPKVERRLRSLEGL